MNEDPPPSQGPQVQVASVGLWLPGYPSAQDWNSGRPADAEHEIPRGSSLKPRDRRRASQLGRALSDASFEALSAADVDPAQVQIVVGSSIAEASTLLRILDQIWRLREPVSPAAFTMSVHNAASGLMSISHGNRGFVTSLAADEDTPAAALLEGLGLVLTTDRPVVVACGDEAAPEDLVPDEQRWDMLAAAVVLQPVSHQGPCLARLRLPTKPGASTSIDPAPISSALGNNPQAGLVDLVHAVAKGASGTLRLDRGSGRGLCAQLEAGRRDDDGAGPAP
jgi:hypothetical protein